MTENTVRITDVKKNNVQQVQKAQNVQQTTQVQQATKPLDKKAESVKQSKESNKSNGKASTKPADDFGRIQEESRRLSDNEVKCFHSGERQIDEGVRSKLADVFERRLSSERNGVRYADTSLVNPDSKEVLHVKSNVDADTFHDVFEVVQKYLPHGDAVTVHEVSVYKNNRNYLSSDGLSGFSITQEGDLVSVFNLGKKGFLKTIAPYLKTEGAYLKTEGAVTLDCFDSTVQPLATIYSKTLGFKTASVMDFNYEIIAQEHGKDYADWFVKTYGEAPVAFMVNFDSNVETKHFGKDEYDAAKDYQMSFLKKETESIEKKASKPRGTSITLLAKVKNSVLASKAFADENSLKSFLNKEIRGSDDVRNRLMNDGKAEVNGYDVTAHKTTKGNLVIDGIKNTQVTESTTESAGSKSESVSDERKVAITNADEKINRTNNKGYNETSAYKEDLERELKDPSSRAFFISSDDFDAFLNDVKSGNKSKGSVIIRGLDYSNLLQILRDSGIVVNPDMPLSISSKNLYKVLSQEKKGTHNHNLSIEQFKSALKEADNPLIIAKRGNDSFSVFTKVRDDAGNLILAAFHVDFTNGNFLVSVYGKSLNSYYFEKNEVIYTNEKELDSLGIIIPTNGPQSPTSTSSNYNLTDNSSKVKSGTQAVP